MVNQEWPQQPFTGSKDLDKTSPRDRSSVTRWALSTDLYGQLWTCHDRTSWDLTIKSDFLMKINSIGLTQNALTIVRWSLLEFWESIFLLWSAIFSFPCDKRSHQVKQSLIREHPLGLHMCSCERVFVCTSGMKKGSLKLRLAAMVSTGSKQPRRAPKRIIFPMWGSTGIRARWNPNGVSSSFRSRAFYKTQQRNGWLFKQIHLKYCATAKFFDFSHYTLYNFLEHFLDSHWSITAFHCQLILYNNGVIDYCHRQLIFLCHCVSFIPLIALFILT